ncbi:MAG: DNA recombination protein RmuC [Parcubacteria group bacterium CG11_big_fil_rev_8_21_14_0_20_39_22]|nr:MAG: DNA recombination protein RmuC [Parcubacteria group bacterium CG11_big_fil_rev_8_21_14_0_20_39_22]
MLALIAGIGIVLIRKSNPKSDGADKSLSLLLSQMNELSRTVDTKMGETNKFVNESIQNQFSESKRLINEINEQVGKNLIDVTRGLTKLDETNKQVVSFADQLQSLQDILKNPKQRGVVGEYYLETLLKNTMPPGSYQMQYGFSDGTIVDAAVFVKDKVIPIDSKFSLENYNRLIKEGGTIEKERLEKAFVNDLKNRIQETAKYIRPEEGTVDFAFMFIPHEAIYYDLLVNTIGALKEDTESLIQRAAGRYRVIIVSPTSFLAYLQTVLQGLKAMQIEETAKDIVKRVGELGSHLKRYEEYHKKLGNSLSTTVSHFNSSGKEFRKIDKDVMRITDSSIEVEELVLDKPEKDE